MENNIFKSAIMDRQKLKMGNDSSIESLSNSLFNRSSTGRVEELSINDIVVEQQLRTEFNDDEIKNLAASIKEHGLLQPVCVHKIKGGSGYKLICGERRYRACLLNSMQKIKAHVVEEPKTQKDLLVLQMVENLQRSKPSVFDCANALESLIEHDENIRPEEFDVIGVSRSLFYTLKGIIKYLDLTEREILKNYHRRIYDAYLQLKKNNPNACQAILDYIQNENPEDIVELENLIKSKLKKDKSAKEKKDKNSTNSKNQTKLTINWKKIDKISPELSARVNQFLDNRQMKAEELLACALERFLEQNADNHDNQRESIINQEIS